MQRAATGTPPANPWLPAGAWTLAITLALPGAAAAQDVDVEPAEAIALEIGGTLQTRAGWGASEGDDGEDVDRLGFGIRRARLRITASLPAELGVRFDGDFSGGSLTPLDLYAFWEPREGVRLRAGSFAGAQPRSYIYTSHTRIDAVDRAAVAERWARGTIGSSGRDFGVDLQLASGGSTVEVYVHNGDGSFDRGRSNFRESVSGSATRGLDRTALAVSTYLSHRPAGLQGLEVGGYASFNASRNRNTEPPGVEAGRRYVSWSGHAYWGADPGSQPFRLTADALGIRYEELDAGAVDLDARHAVGVALLAAARVLQHGEAFARWERFDEGGGADAEDFVTAGLSYSFGSRRGLAYRQQRLTLAWASGLPAGEREADQHLLVLQAQILF